MAKKLLTIWFNDKGNLVSVVRPWMLSGGNNYNLKSEEGKDFSDRMEYVKVSDGGTSSAARLHLKSTMSGREYSMYLDDFHDVIMAKLFVDNHIEGDFRFVKKGTSQAIKLILPSHSKP